MAASPWKTAPGGVDAVLGSGLAPNPHLAPVSYRAPPFFAREDGPWGRSQKTCSALWTPHPICGKAAQRPKVTPQARQTDRPMGRASPRRDPSPLCSQGRPESAGLRPKAGLAAATVTNWRLAIGQHIVFHLRLQIPLRRSLSPLAQTSFHLEKREVCVGSRLPAGPPWPFAPGLGDCPPEAGGRVSGPLAPSRRERT